MAAYVLPKLGRRLVDPISSADVMGVLLPNPDHLSLRHAESLRQA